MKISLITVAFNNEATIADCIDSVDGQSFANWEHMLVDGASQDRTVERIEQHADRRRRWVSEPDEGVYDAMNKGLSRATGEVVGILNADDLFADDQVLASVADIFQDSSVEAVYGDLVYVHPERTDRIVRSWKAGPFRREAMLYGWMPPHPTVFLRRSLYERFGHFRPEFTCSGDYELMVRLFFKERVVPTYLPKVLVRMRTGGISNGSLRKRWIANREDRIAWKINGLHPPFYTTLLKPLRKIGQFKPV